MCSIMGYTGKDIKMKDFMEGFGQTLSRGPDMSRVIETKSGILAFHRLAIMDLEEAGMQPFQMEQDYAMYLRCRGLQDGRILLFHAFPHAVVDLLPSFAQMLGLCLANAAIVERVFSLSGLGYLIIDAVVKRDSPVIHAAVLVLALTLVLLDTVAELLQYALRSDMRAAGGRA